MILYNVTVSIDENIHQEWLDWMRKVHVPEVMATGFFLEASIAKIHAEEDGGKTYAIAYKANSMTDLEEYQEQYAPRLQKEHAERYAGKFAAFRTFLEVIEEFK